MKKFSLEIKKNEQIKGLLCEMCLFQVVAEKSLQKNVHIVFNRSDRMKHLKFEKRKQNEEYHLYFHLHITLCLPKGVHKM